MFMLDIEYDSNKLVGMDNAEEKAILRSAVTTLHEAIKKAISLYSYLSKKKGKLFRKACRNIKFYLETDAKVVPKM